jgi:hypothetical protein
LALTVPAQPRVRLRRWVLVCRLVAGRRSFLFASQVFS